MIVGGLRTFFHFSPSLYAALPTRSPHSYNGSKQQLIGISRAMPRIDLVHTTPEAAFAQLSQSSFRTKFHLTGKAAAHALLHSSEILLLDALDFLSLRIAARPANDGRQTPMRGHPVFVAQHACALCCRGCMQKWYGIAEDRELTSEELGAAARLILAWIEREKERLRADPERVRQNGRPRSARQQELIF